MEQEQLVRQPEVEQINRRTDDILFNVKYLSANIVDREAGIFLPEAEADVLEQNSSEISEADVHKLGVVVYQQFDSELNQYVSLGAGTVDHADNGRDALDLEDLTNWFEYSRRSEEGIEERRILEPETQAGMRGGKAKIYISPAPTYHEADPDVAGDFGYDDRTMIRIQRLSPDGKTKIMKSFSLFNAPAKAWADLINSRGGAEIDSTALAVMQESGAMPLVEGSDEQILTSLLTGVKEHLPEYEQDRVDTQLEAFLQDQESLAEQVDYYAREKLDFQKELALSLNSKARPAVLNKLRAVEDNLGPPVKLELSKRMINNQLYVDDYVANLLIKINTVTIDNRAGLATHNERTVKRVASSVGLDATLEMAQAEQFIQVAAKNNMDTEFMVTRNEQKLADSGASCEGGCAVGVVGLFSSEASKAREAGLKGTLYESKSLDKGSKCTCAKNNKQAKVISDGKSVVCIKCGDYKVGGKLGSLKKSK